MAIGITAQIQEKVIPHLCEPRRSQTGEAGRGASGSTILPEGESHKGPQHDGEAGVWANMPNPTPRKARAIWSRLDCLNPSLQRWNVTSRATACQGAVGRIGRSSFRRPKLPLPSDGQRGRSRGRTGDLRCARTFDLHGHGIAYRPRGLWRRSGRSSPRTGKPSTWRRAAGVRRTDAEIAGMATAESNPTVNEHWKAG